MGKVIVKLKLTNQGDLVLTKRKLSKIKPRTVEVEALVDTGGNPPLPQAQCHQVTWAGESGRNHFPDHQRAEEAFRFFNV